MEKVNSRIISANSYSITNDKTGVINDMTKIYYLVDIDNDDNNLGKAVFLCYRQGNLISRLKDKINKDVVLGLAKVPNTNQNGFKYIIKTIDGQEL